ncbi:glycosyltransferase family 2 protein [Candidatus Aerophobetes bacterium]|nr:glycosyltransferase family 2 protein [Candidatus Aerophobetes bacterium]
MLVSIVIPTYNRKIVLRRCLELLFNQNFPKSDYEIIVVDNGSTDETDKMVNSLSPPCRFLFLKEERRGPHIARNMGIKNARGEIVVFVDSDILTPPDFLKEHLRFHTLYGEKVIVSGPTVRTDNLMDDFSDIEKRKKMERLFNLSGPSPITSNLSVRRKYLIEVGGFDEDFEGLGWHDWELNYRLKKLGLVARKNIDAIVYHYKEKRKLQSFERLEERRVQRGINAVLFYKKHPTLEVKFKIKAHQLLTDKFTFWLDTSFGEKVLKWTEKNDRFLFDYFVRLKLDRAYVRGLREGMKKHKVKLWPWMQV